MKIRNGFISNSSSSSFVIIGDIPSDGKITIDLKSFGTIIRTKEKFLEYFNDNYGYSYRTFDEMINDVEFKEDYSEMDTISEALKQIKSGKSVIMGNVDNYGVNAISEILPDTLKIASDD